MATRIVTQRGFHFGNFSLGATAKVKAPTAKALDARGNGDGWLDANEMKQASTKELRTLLGEIDGENFREHMGSLFGNGPREELATGAGDVIWQELKSRGDQEHRINRAGVSAADPGDDYMAGFNRMAGGE